MRAVAGRCDCLTAWLQCSTTPQTPNKHTRTYSTPPQEIKALQPDLIIGDATASYGFWLSGLTGIPSIEFDVGTSSGLLHSMHGGQFNPAYVPAPGVGAPGAGGAYRVLG